MAGKKGKKMVGVNLYKVQPRAAIENYLEAESAAQNMPFLKEAMERSKKQHDLLEMQAKREADRLRERQEAERARRLAEAQAEAETRGDEAQRSAAAAANTNNYTNNRTMSEKQKRALLWKAIVGREFLVSPTFDDQPTPELRAAAAPLKPERCADVRAEAQVGERAAAHRRMPK